MPDYSSLRFDHDPDEITPTFELDGKRPYGDVYDYEVFDRADGVHRAGHKLFDYYKSIGWRYDNKTKKWEI